MTPATGLQGAPLPAHLDFTDAPQISYEMVNDTRFRCVLFIGDLLTLDAKRADIYRLGGRLFDHARTLPYQYLARCAITPLREAMDGVPAHLIADTERDKYLPGYTRKNVLVNAATGERRDIVVGGKGSMSAGLRFKKIMPVQETGYLVRDNDGTVVLDFLANVKEAVEAQYHYFPEWAMIVRGSGSLFEAFNNVNLAQLRDHLANRRSVAADANLQRVGDAFMQSCDQFEVWANSYLQRQTTMIELAKKTPEAVFHYDQISERLFRFLQLTPQDDIVRSLASNIGQQSSKDGLIAEALNRLTDLVAQGQQVAAAQTPPAAVPDLTAQQAYEEAMNAETGIEEHQEEAPEPAAEADEIVLTDVPADFDYELGQEEASLGTCSEANGAGNPCKAKVVRRRVSDRALFCKYHPTVTA